MRCSPSARVWPTHRPGKPPWKHSRKRSPPARRQLPDCSTPIFWRPLTATLARNWGSEPDDAESIRFGRSVGDWPAFEDAADSLAYLKGHHRLVTLTNCDRASYRGSAARLGNPWDAVFTAEEIGSYKPAAANFEYLLERVEADFGCGPGSVLHVAQSLFHDHVPAKEMGLTTAWIDRRAGRGGGATAAAQEEVTPDFRFDSMAELVARHRAERG